MILKEYKIHLLFLRRFFLFVCIFLSYNFIMLTICTGVITRIISNSYLNVFQKLLTNKEQKSSVINFYTYLGLSVCGLFFLNQISISSEIFANVLIMGFFGALGNYFIIKALSLGDLSAIAPINSYKPIVAMIIGFIYLGEIPSLNALLGIALIIGGTYFVLGVNNKTKVNKRAILYRVMALVFSGTEAIFIKKIILLSGVVNAFFLWAFSGLVFSLIFLLISRHKPVIKSYRYQLLLILSVGIMQYSTNYVFAKMNVAYALALFQLSTILSVFLGANLFKEDNLKEKLIGSIIMAIGAVIIILN